MSANYPLLFLAGLLNFSLGIWVLAKGPRKTINCYFALFSIAVAVWTLANGLVSLNAATPWGYLWARVTFASASVISLSLFMFATVFPSKLIRVPRTIYLPVIIAGVCSFFVSFTQLIVRNTSSADGHLVVQYGPLHPAFAAYFILCLGLSLFLLVRKLHIVDRIQAIQVRYLLLGTLIAGLGASITNLIIPLTFGTSRFSQYGPLFSFIMIAMIAHAIVRHRLMDIRVVIKKGVVYIVAFGVAGALLAGLIVGSSLVFPTQEWRLWREVFLSLLVAVLFHPLKTRIQRACDRYLYREPFDYQRTVREASRTMATLLDLRALLHYVGEVIGETIRPERLSVYLREREGRDYRHALTRLFGEAGANGERQSHAADDPLLRALAAERTHLVRDDLRRDDLAPETRAGLEALAALGSEVALPLLKEDQVTGLLLVGPKRSGDPYFQEDLDLLTTLASQAAVAVTNAQLYAEVVLVNEYVANILKTMESGVIAAGVDGRVTLVNGAAERLTGLAAESLRGAPASLLPAALADLVQATLEDGVPRLQVETTLAVAAGPERPLVCSTSSFADVDGRVLGAVLVFSDLSRLKELEGEKRRAERLASFGALASGIAHEIKNPLVAIKAFAQLLPKKFADAEFRQDFSRVAAREIERIDELVERLRVLAAPPRPPEPVDLRGPVEETLELLRGQLDQKGIALERGYGEDLPAVLGEPVQLRQLFLNLFQNALDAMEAGGTLSVRLHRRQANGDTAVVVEVADTGPGIPEGLREKVFEPFYSTKPRGTGLGLAICRGIADTHRATIRAEPGGGGRGATLAVVFPAALGIPSEARA